jgi:succinoglycan biosynthesis protein ExoA
MPLRNEQVFLPSSLGAVLGQTYPKEALQIIVVDGLSTDGTAEAVKTALDAYHLRHPAAPTPRVVTNSRRSAAAAMNEGLRHVQGDVVVRVDGHCVIPADYVATCVRTLQESGAGVVGGRVINVRGGAPISRAIGLAQSSRFGVGGASFRLRTRRAGAVDTVAFPAYRRGVFDEFGVFDEDLMRNQDDEFHFRLTQSGVIIWLNPAIEVQYYGRQTLGSLASQYFEYGLYKVRVMQKRRAVATARQLVPPAFVLALALSGAGGLLGRRGPIRALAVAYGTALTIGTLSAAEADRGSIVVLPAVFLTMHLSYGVGWLAGCWRWRHGWRALRRGFVNPPASSTSRKRSTAGDGLMYRERHGAVGRLVAGALGVDVRTARVLDVGCGTGAVLASLTSLGFRSERLFGVDADPRRVAEAKASFPFLRFTVARAQELPFEGGRFDLVLMFTVMSSIIDGSEAAAREATRVLTREGAILWYDMRYPNPRNRSIRALPRQRIAKLFPSLATDLVSITLIPQLARAIAPRGEGLYLKLASLSLLRSHYIGLLRKVA